MLVCKKVHVFLLLQKNIEIGILQKCVNAGRTDCPPAVDVFVQTPFYSGYPSLVEYISTANWNPRANISSEFTIEIVTLVIPSVYNT